MKPSRPTRPSKPAKPDRAPAGTSAPLAAPGGSLRHAAIVLAVLWAILFAPQLFGARVFVLGDTGFLRAFAEFSAERWSEHRERTHWNPYVFAGLPATASMQDSRPQWLPGPLLDAFDGLHRLPGFPPLAIPLLVHLAGMIAVAALARRLWGAGTVAMILGGLAWGLPPGLLVPLAFGQEWMVMAMSLTPVLLLAVVRTCEAASEAARWRAALSLAAAVAALFYAGHPQVVGYALLVAIAFALVRPPGERRIRSAFFLLAGAATGAAMAAALWWPALRYNAHSVRGAAAGGVPMSELASWSAGWPDLLSLALPWAAGFGGSNYWGGLRATDFPHFLGITIVALAACGLARRDRGARHAWLLAAIALAAMTLALGVRLGQGYRDLFPHIPLWSSARVAIRTLIVAQLAIALLAARGADRMIASAAAAPRRWLRGAAAIAALGLLLAGALNLGIIREPLAAAVRASRPGMDGATVQQGLDSVASDSGMRLVLLAAWIAAAAWSASRRPWLSGALLVAIVATDIGSVSAPFLARATGSLATIERPPAPGIALAAAAEPHYRALDLTAERRFSNDWIRWRARSFSGNHPAVPRYWDEVVKEGAARTYGSLCALSIGFLGGVGGDDLDSARFERLGEAEDGSPYWRVRGALPRAYAVSRVTPLNGDREVLAALADPAFNPVADAFTTEPAPAGDYPGAASCRIRWLEDAPDRLEWETHADAPAFLVVADAWLPGWTATLDGRPQPIHRVQHMLRGVALPAGTHRLRMTYEPEGWAAGLRWSRIAWVLWLAGAAWVAIAAVRGRRRAA